MAPARYILHHARAALCAALLAATPLALLAQAAPPPAPADQAPAPASDQPAAPAAAPQLNDDGTPKLDAAGNPLTAPPEPPPPPPCVPSKGHKCPKVKKKKKEKAPKVEPVTISRGIFTVDGVIGKAALNYDIPDMKFIYFYAPGIGAVVISDNKFSGAVEQKGAFKEHSLTVKVAGDHTMELYSDEILLSKRGTAGKVSKQNKKAESAFIVYDPNFTLPVKFPIVGYGKKPTAPYEWPGSKLNVITKGIAADAPAVPTRLAPRLSANPCPTGQVLMNGNTVVPTPPAAPANAAAAKSSTTATAANAPPPATLDPSSHLKCVPANQVPVAPPPQEKYIPLDQRPRS